VADGRGGTAALRAATAIVAGIALTASLHHDPKTAGLRGAADTVALGESALPGYVGGVSSITHGRLRIPLPTGIDSYVRTTLDLRRDPATSPVGEGPIRVTSYQLLHPTGALTVSVVDGYAKTQAGEAQLKLRTAPGATEVQVGSRRAVLRSSATEGLALQWTEPDSTIVTIAARDLDRQLVLDVADSVTGR
jgi:hypothetical protein